MHTHTLAAVLLLAVGATAAQADWPQWRGPAGNGSSPDALPFDDFNPDDLANVRWIATMTGPSAATPAVVGDRLFLTSYNTATGKLQALALDANTGQELWARDAADGVDASGRRGTENYLAEPSPAADDQRVIFGFGTGDLLAADHDGNVLWSVNLVEKFGRMQIGFGYAASPLLVGDKVYVAVIRRNDPAYLACFNASTGELLFKHDRSSPARGESREAYTTPVAATIARSTQIIVYGADAVTAHHPDTGDELWRYDQLINPSNQGNFRTVAGLTPGDDDTLYFTAPRGKTLFALKITDNQPALAWERADLASDVATPAYHAGTLFLLNGEKKSVTRLDAATGKTLWTHQLDAASYCRASPTLVGDKLAVLSAEGEFYLLSTGDQPKQLLKLDLAGYPARASVAASGGALYIRTADRLVCAAASAE